MDAFRNFRSQSKQQQDPNAARAELFAGTTKSYGANQPPQRYPPPSQGGYYPPPQQGSGQYPPPPQQGGGQYPPPPQQGGGQYPPPSQQGGYYPPPQQGGYYPPPQQGGYYPPPQQGGQYGYSQRTEEEEIDDIKGQIRSVKQESLNSTQRSLQLLRQAEASGEATLTKLGEQSQRLNYTDRQFDIAQAHADRAQEKVAKLKKVNGSMFGFDFSAPFTGGRSEQQEMERIQMMQEQQRATRASDRDTQKRINQVLDSKQPMPGSHQQQQQQQQQRAPSNRSRYQFEEDDEDNAMEGQLDRDLDEMGRLTSRLNAMAKATNAEVITQNSQLDRMNAKAEKVHGYLDMTTESLRRIK